MTTVPPINGTNISYQTAGMKVGSTLEVAQVTTNHQSAQVGQEASPSSQDVPSVERLLNATERINSFLQPVTNDITFSVDEDTGSTVVKVIDRETKDVIRQIPSEEILAIAKALDRLQGLLIRQTA